MIKNLDRRRFLVALLGIPAAYLGLADRQLSIEAHVLLVNDDPMSFLEDMLSTRWRNHLMGGPSQAAGGLEHVVNATEDFAQKMRGKGWHGRALAQLCLAYQLQGSVQGDLMNYDQALSSYKQALTVASELDDQELIAAIRVRQGIVFMRKDDPLKAIKYLNYAHDLIYGRGLPLLRGNALALLSEAYAKASQAQECWRTIGLAERVLDQPSSEAERSHRVFNPSMVAAHKGVDALLLGDYERALVLFEKSLVAYNPTMTPGRARLLARKAEAYLGLREIDYCVDVAEQALQLARFVGANNTLKRLEKLYGTLQASHWKREASVLRLGALLEAR